MELLFIGEELVLGGGSDEDFGAFDLLGLGEELLGVGDSATSHSQSILFHSLLEIRLEKMFFCATTLGYFVVVFWCGVSDIEHLL